MSIYYKLYCKLWTVIDMSNVTYVTEWMNKYTKPNQTSNTLLPKLCSTVDNDSTVTIWTTFYYINW